MLHTDLDFRVKESKKVIQVGLNIKDLGNFVAFIEDEEDAFTQFVLGVENGGNRFVLLTARIIVEGQISITMSDMCVRANDITFIQKLDVGEA